MPRDDDVTRDGRRHARRLVRARYLLLVLLGLSFASCAARLPSVQEVNEAVLGLRQHAAWAWLLGIGLIWADVVLPIPQTAIIGALGIIYGGIGGGLVGSIGLVTGGLLGYELARRLGRDAVARMVGESALSSLERVFERRGTWAIVLTRSLPYSVPEAVVCIAGLAGMRIGPFIVALILGSVPTAFVFSAIGAGWNDQPALALVISYVLPIPLVPLMLLLLRRSDAHGEHGTS